MPDNFFLFIDLLSLFSFVNFLSPMDSLSLLLLLTALSEGLYIRDFSTGTEILGKLIESVIFHSGKFLLTYYTLKAA